MNRLITGIVFFITGVFVLVITHQNTISYIPKLERVPVALGEYRTALIETYGIIPLIIGTLIALLGFILLLSICYVEYKND